MKVVETLSASRKPLPIAKVAELLKAESFSTIKFFMNKEAIDFNCRFTAKDMVGSVKKFARQFSSLVADQ